MRKLTVGTFTVNGAEVIIKKSQSNPAWGSVMVVEHKKILVKGAKFETKRIGFYRDKLVNLNALGLTKDCDLQPILAKDFGADYTEQRVVVVETTTPQYAGHTPKINPEKPTEAILVNGAPVYYQAYLDNADVADIKIVAKTASIASIVAASAEAFAQ